MNKELRIMDERELVKCILSGKKDDFERFYRQTVGELRQFVMGRVGKWEVAEELVQDTYLSFLDSLPLFSFRSTLKTFLYSIARHEVADHWRRVYAKRVLKLVPLVGEFVSGELYTTHELSTQIEKVYRQILPEYAHILRLKYERGWSVGKIALSLKLSVKAAESRLFRARKAFQLAYATVTATSD